MRYILSITLILALSIPAVGAEVDQPERPRNVILFVMDGFGPSMATMARDYRRDVLHEGDHLAMDAIEVGSVRTRSSDNRVTDSAAGATAYATGHRSYNGSIAVDDDGRPLGTVLEAARDRGFRTGVVSTTRITHATPAAFTAHVPRRAMEAEIAEQQIESGADIILGGGLRNFLPETEGGIRPDDRNLLDEARQKGYEVALTWPEVQASGLPLLGLLDSNSLPYELDRKDDEPSLADLTRYALDRLYESGEQFFVMIEAARIDHAAHGNDAAATLHDVLAFDDAIAVALEYVERDGNTLLIAVPDHETGGMSLGRAVDGRSIYGWHPEVLTRVRSSHSAMIDAIENDQPIDDVMREYAGIDELSEDERLRLSEAREQGALNTALADVIARRALIGWTTGGHTATDVKLFAAGPGRDRLVGNHENYYVGQVIAELLELDLDAVTERLRADQSAEVLQN